MEGNKGFTILELVLVVAVIGIIVAIAVPSIQSSTSSYNVTTGADQLAGEIQTGRLLAVTRNATLQMIFDASKGTYQVTDPDDPDNPPRSQKSLPTGVTFQQAPASLTFYSRGNSPGGTIQIGNSKFSMRMTVKSTEIVTEQVGY
ncbi:MAG TPA: GspH/FimT family pseudopilin [Acidobacteriota bacterium]|jgi:prepilin-type N-terminal cleavage/methylation domain-containing protein